MTAHGSRDLHGPGFVVIGPQRTGTTWLYRNLRRHPGIWIHPAKETHYLDRSPPGLYARIGGRDRHLRKARRLLVRQMLERTASRDDMLRAVRFAFGRRDDRWYLRQFLYRDEVLTGEIAPGYFAAPEPAVERLTSLCSRTNFVCSLRNPIEWSWSATVAHFRRRGLSIESAPDAAVAERIRSVRRPAEWMADGVERWERSVPAHRLKVLFLDQVADDAAGTLSDVLTFLGAEASDDPVPDDVHERRHAQPYEGIPQRFLGQLAEREYTHVRRLHRHFSNVWTASWLRAADRALAGESAGRPS
ncbi:MAG: sulfotransferase [Candidatus Binatia bacterium]